eukprot:s2538_g11.t1
MDGAEHLRSHLLKATLLGWAARAGLDKETRSVLGHHCSAVSGYEVVYSRQLQTRALRKLAMLLRCVRVGLGLEHDAMKEFGISGTSVPFTPAFLPGTPVVQTEQGHSTDADHATGANREGGEVVSGAVDAMIDLEELNDVKEEALDNVNEVGAEAVNLTLFHCDLVSSGAFESRLKELGLSDEFAASVTRHGVRTLSQSKELQGTSRDRELTLEGGSLVLKTQQDKITSPTDSEIKVHYATVRRAIAMELGKLLSYEQRSQWEPFLFESMHREAPPGYARPSLLQILQCDEAAFSRLAEIVPSIRQQADGTYPLGVALLNLRSDPNVTLYLAPIAKPSQSFASGPPHIPQKVEARAKAKKAQRAARQCHRHSLANGQRIPKANLFASDRIVQAAAQRHRQEESKTVSVAPKVGTFAVNRVACKATACSATRQVVDNWLRPFNIGFGNQCM